MSSYELLELFGAVITEDSDRQERTIEVEFAPENGALARALRGGERSERDQAIVQTANEVAVIRAAKVPGAHADEYESRLFLPMARLREIADEQRLRAEDIHTDEPGGLFSTWQQKED